MQLKPKDFIECFGSIKGCEHLIKENNFTYNILPNYHPENVSLRVVGNKDVWQKGWGENLEEFEETHSESALIPKYYHPDRVLRYKDNYIQPENPDFEYHFLEVLRAQLFAMFKDYNPIYEFGCGTGFNLLNLTRMYPKKELHGLDWAEPTVGLINEINKTYNTSIKAHLFDMFNPPVFDIPDGSAIFTWGALEQLGERFEPFLNFLLSKKIFVINIEPIIELYNIENPLDKYSIEYMNKRGYLKGYLKRLCELQRHGQIEINQIKRIHFGNLNYEGWSFVIWNTK
jgi:hypothetical protein